MARCHLPGRRGTLREPITEFNSVFGTWGDNPRLPLHLSLAALDFAVAGDGLDYLNIGRRRRPWRSIF
jgi:hypothetical protein